MAKRKNELSIASIIFMLLVIFIHVSAECVDGYITTSIQFAVICSLHRLSSFVVQGFIFLSGLKLFINFRDDFSYGKFYLSRLKRVVLPYLAVFCLFYIYFIATGSISPSINHFVSDLFSGGLVGHFYFVAIICQFYLLMPIWRLLYRRGNAIAVTVLSLLLMLLCKEYLPTVVKALFDYEMKYNSRLFTYYLFYFVCGIYAGKYYDGFVTFIRNRKGIIYSAWAMVGIIDCALIYLIRRGIYYPTWAEGWHVLYCTLAIAGTLTFVITLSDGKIATSKPITMLDSASYNVYLIHPLCIFFIDSVSNRLGITSLTLRFVIKGLFTLFFAIGACLLVEYIKKTTNPKAKEFLYYLSPFILIPAVFLLMYLFDEVVGAPPFFGIVLCAILAVASFLTARHSNSKHASDPIIATAFALALFAFMFVINYLDAGETYSRFDLAHAMRYAISPSSLIVCAICFASGLIGSLKKFRRK